MILFEEYFIYKLLIFCFHHLFRFLLREFLSLLTYLQYFVRRLPYGTEKYHTSYGCMNYEDGIAEAVIHTFVTCMSLPRT